MHGRRRGEPSGPTSPSASPGGNGIGAGPRGSLRWADHGHRPHLPPRRRAGRHRLLRRPGHLGRRRLDAGQGRHPLRVHRRPRPVRRARPLRRPRPGQGVRRRAGPARRLPLAARARRSRRPAVRRLPHRHRRPDLLQHHAPRAGGHRHPPRTGDAGRRGRHLGRRLDLQGQRHRALLPLRPARQPQPAHLQAVAGRGLRRRARRPGGDERVADRARPPLPRQQGEGLLDRRQHLGRHPRGEAARAARRGDGPGRADHGRGALGRGGGDRAGDRHRRLPGGLAGVDQRRRAGRPGRARAGWPTRSAAATDWG